MTIEMPVLRIELDRVRETAMHMFMDQGDEINRMIGKTLDRVLTEEWVQQRIDESVIACVKSAIDGIANSYALKTSLTQAIENMLVESVRGKNG